jgi:hypothetical protein
MVRGRFIRNNGVLFMVDEAKVYHCENRENCGYDECYKYQYEHNVCNGTDCKDYSYTSRKCKPKIDVKGSEV